MLTVEQILRVAKFREQYGSGDVPVYVSQVYGRFSKRDSCRLERYCDSRGDVRLRQVKGKK